MVGAGRVGGRTWLHGIGAARRALIDGRAKPELGQPDVPAGRKKEERSVALLIASGVPKSVAEAHAELLAPSIDHIAALAHRTDRLSAHDARRLERVLDTLYKTIDRGIKKGGDPASFASDTLAAMNALAARVARADDLVAALAAATGIFESGVRLGRPWADAAAFAGDFLDRIDGRTNQSAALNVLANVVEQVERKEKANTDAERQELFGKAASFLIESSPREGFDQAITGELAGRLARALREQPDVDTAIAAAQTDFLAAREPGRDRARVQAEAAPEPLRAALLAVVDANPAGPEALFLAVGAAAEKGAILTPHAEMIASLRERGSARRALELLVAGVDPAKLAVDDELGLQVSLALHDRDAPEELIAAAKEHARTRALSDPVPELRLFADRWLAVKKRLGDPEVSTTIAGATPFADVGQALKVVELLRTVELLFPKIDRPLAAGLLSELLDPARQYFSPVEELLESLLAEAAPHAPTARKQAELFPLAVRLARPLAEIADNGPLFKRVRQDWGLAIQSPEKLARTAGSGVALRAKNEAPSIGSFLRDHASLPLEAALTIGLHLDGERFAWVQSEMTSTRKHDYQRALRDTVSACVDAGQLGFLDVLRAAKAPKKAIERAMDEVARAFRGKKLDQIPFEQWAAALHEGRDPVFELEQKRIDETLADLNLGELAGGHLDPAGLEQILACKAEITTMLEQFVPGHRPPLDTELDYGCLRPTVLDTLRSVAEGTWPAPKYENEVGKRMMGRLTAEQQAIWREPMLTHQAPPANEADRASLDEARLLLNGLAKALPLALPLAGDLTWDAVSLEKVRREQAEAVTRLRAMDKDHGERRPLAKSLGALSESLAFLELQQALAHLDANAAPSDLRALRPLLEEARGRASRHQTGRGISDAITKVLDAVGGLKDAPRQGRYAADEDTLEALWTANKTGCLSVAGGATRIWGLPGVAADANIRRLRVYDGDRQVFRASLKFFPVKFDGYEGIALFVDNPKSDGGGTDEDRRLAHRHAMEKALRMGIPVLAGALYAGAYQGWEQLAKDGQDRGLEVKRDADVHFYFEEGNTPYQHSDCVLNNDHGGTNFHGRIRDHRGENEFWERDLKVKTIVMPRAPGRAAEG